MVDWVSRYNTPLTRIFSEEHKLSLQLRVELALLESLAEHGMIPAEAAKVAKQALDEGKVKVERVREIERETHHDIMAMVKALTEQCGEHGGFVHYGATSQDINDTVTGLQLKESKAMLLEELDRARKELTRLAKKYRDVAAIGRTHGQHAIPITYGHKFANFLYEITVARGHLERTKVEVGKFAGAVGTFASLATRKVGDTLLRSLGLEPLPITTQDYMFALTSTACALERIAKEIRNLQRTEISELSEGFDKKQVGSSTMPQKRNPHKSERICGLARIVRAQLNPTLETISLEHERDLTNSSVERVTLSSGSCVLHYMLLEMVKILSNLQVDEENAKRNLYLLGGRQLAERIMMTLASKIGRQEAHEILRQHSAFDDFADRLKKDEQIAKVLTPEDVDDLLRPESYTGLSGDLVDNVVAEYGVSE